jgi:hypothetical protein
MTGVKAQDAEAMHEGLDKRFDCTEPVSCLTSAVCLACERDLPFIISLAATLRSGKRQRRQEGLARCRDTSRRQKPLDR